MRVFIAILGLMCASAQAQTPSAVPVDIQIPVSPTPFASKGELHYVYEIHLTNFDRRGRSLTLSRIEVLNESGNQLAKFGAEDLSRLLMQPGLAERAADSQKLGPGRRAVFFMWVPMGEGTPHPTSLQHRFVLTIDGVAGDNTVECCHTAIPRASPVVIAPPLRGGGWLAGNGPSNSSDHCKALLAVDGRLYLAQRFAIDWIQFGKNGELAVGKGAENRDFASYGAEVLAVGSGG
jgi:hypothetical protein